MKKSVIIFKKMGTFRDKTKLNTAVFYFRLNLISRTPLVLGGNVVVFYPGGRVRYQIHINYALFLIRPSNIIHNINIIGIYGSLIWSKTLMELIFNPCSEFRLSLEGPVSQIHSPRLHVGVPGIFQIFQGLYRC